MKDYTDKQSRCLRKRLMKSYAAQAQTLLLKREGRHWKRKSCVMGVIWPLQETIIPEPVITGYVKLATNNIQMVFMCMCQIKEVEVILVQLQLQLVL